MNNRHRRSFLVLWEWMVKHKWMCILIAYSLAVDVFMIKHQLWSNENFTGYFPSFNWSAFPLFWLAIFLLLHVSWEPFKRAWCDMIDSGVVRSATTSPKQAKAHISRDLDGVRRKWLFIPFVATLLITCIDVKTTYHIYSSLEKKQKFVPVEASNPDYIISDSSMCLPYLKQINFEAPIVMLDNLYQLKNCKLSLEQFYDATRAVNTLESYLSKQVEREENKPIHDLFYLPKKRLFYKKNGISQAAHSNWLEKQLAKLTEPKCKVCSEEIDWTVAWLFPEFFRGEPVSKEDNGLAVILAYSQQFVIVFLAFVVLENMILHLYYFWRLPQVEFKSGESYSIHYDYESKIGEFGLESWNQALNNQYWVLSLAISIPLFSAASQPADDVGQLMLRIFVPLLYLAPLFLTIIVRQKYLPEVWVKVRNSPKESAYRQQLLWPLDRNWVSKLGIILAFVLLSYLVGISFADFINL